MGANYKGELKGRNYGSGISNLYLHQLIPHFTYLSRKMLISRGCFRIRCCIRELISRTIPLPFYTKGADMDWQKNIKIATFVTSIIAFILGFIVYMVYLAGLTDNDFIFALLSGGVLFALVWGAYFYGTLWIK